MTQSVAAFIQQDKRHTIRQVSVACGISKGLAHKVIKQDLKLTKKKATSVPHLLTPPQKERCVNLACEALDIWENRHEEIDMDHLITEDESWFWVWEPASKQANAQWLSSDEGCPQVVRVERSTLKTMLVVFFDRFGMVYHEFVPDGRGIGQILYWQILDRFREAVRRRRPEAWRTRWGLLHDGAPAHRAIETVRYLNYHQIPIMPHPGYSPDLSPPDFWLFARIKKEVRGTRFRTIAALQARIDQVIGGITQAEFTQAMENYPDRLRRCIAAQGEYFEH